uniref:MYND-type domain-containing protein n=1 Tax=Anopheles epiroticus TaxID=199890 RepID=A0A182PD67_9DIPT
MAAKQLFSLLGCNFCSNKDANFQCSTCGTYYCGVTCQINHWATHKDLCIPRLVLATPVQGNSSLVLNPLNENPNPPEPVACNSVNLKTPSYEQKAQPNSREAVANDSVAASAKVSSNVQARIENISTTPVPNGVSKRPLSEQKLNKSKPMESIVSGVETFNTNPIANSGVSPVIKNVPTNANQPGQEAVYDKSIVKPKIPPQSATNQKLLSYDSFPEPGRKVKISFVAGDRLYIYDSGLGPNGAPNLFQSLIVSSLECAMTVKDCISAPPKVNDILFAPFEDEFYRAVIKSVQDDTAELFFPDFGNSLKIEWRKLKEIPDPKIKYAKIVTHPVWVNNVKYFTPRMSEFLETLVDMHEFVLTTVIDMPNTHIRMVEMRDVCEEFMLSAKLLELVEPSATKNIKNKLNAHLRPPNNVPKLVATNPVTYKPVNMNELIEATIAESKDAELVISYALHTFTDNKLSVISKSNHKMYEKTMMECQMYGQIDPNPYNPQEDELCLVKVKDIWHRATPMDFVDGKAVQFFLFDLPAFAEVEQDAPLRRYPPCLTRHLYAIECVVENPDILLKAINGDHKSRLNMLPGMVITADVHHCYDADIGLTTHLTILSVKNTLPDYTCIPRSAPKVSSKMASKQMFPPVGCTSCTVQGANFQCFTCGTYYCGVSCQINHWPTHKDFCIPRLIMATPLLGNASLLTQYPPPSILKPSNEILKAPETVSSTGATPTVLSNGPQKVQEKLPEPTSNRMATGKENVPMTPVPNHETEVKESGSGQKLKERNDVVPVIKEETTIKAATNSQKPIGTGINGNEKPVVKTMNPLRAPKANQPTEVAAKELPVPKTMPPANANNMQLLQHGSFPEPGRKVKISFVAGDRLYIYDSGLGPNGAPNLFQSLIVGSLECAMTVKDCISAPPKVNDILFAPFEDDFYRAVIKTVQGDTAELFFPDFGNSLKIEWRKLKEIPDPKIKYAKIVTHPVWVDNVKSFTPRMSEFLETLVDMHEFVLTTVIDMPNTHIRMVEMRNARDQYILSAKLLAMQEPAASAGVTSINIKKKLNANLRPSNNVPKLVVTNPVTYKPVNINELAEANLDESKGVELIITHGLNAFTQDTMSVINKSNYNAFEKVLKECHMYGQIDPNQYNPQDNELCLVKVKDVWYRGTPMEFTDGKGVQFYLFDINSLEHVEPNAPVRRYPPGLTRNLYAAECVVENPEVLLPILNGDENQADMLGGVTIKADVHHSHDDEIGVGRPADRALLSKKRRNS